MAAHKFKLCPYHLLKQLYSGFEARMNSEQVNEPELPKVYYETPKEYFETDPAQIISISRPHDIQRSRDTLISLLWGDSTLPKQLPSEVTKNFHDDRCKEFASLSRIDRIVVDMEFGIQSVVYHFLPIKPNHEIVIYHQGHSGDFFRSKDQINALLDSGYSVAAFCMPLFGMNNKPTVNLPGLGTLRLTRHDHFKLLNPEDGHPVKYFIEPVIAVINYLEKKHNISSVSMIGISGGGWTTTLAAALDTRIKMSFPVAGSLPLYLRNDSDWGDYEQTAPQIYRAVNYLEMYIMGSYGQGRMQVQILNQFDTCCFYGTKSETYKEFVKEKVKSLGAGGFDLFLDDSHKEHKISERAIGHILNILSAE